MTDRDENMLRIFSFLLLLPAILCAQDVLTFREAVQLALEHNHQIQAARNTAEIAHNQVNIGNADLLPRVSLVSSVSYLDSEAPGNVTTENTTTSANAQLSYTLFDGFGNIYRFKRLQSAGQAGDLQARMQIENMLYQVSSAYYNYALAFENDKISRDLVQISRQRLDRAKNKAKFGQANTIEILSAQVDFNADSVDALRSELELNQARRNLNLLLNREIKNPMQVETEVAFLPEKEYNELYQSALSKNASYLLEVNRLQQEYYGLKIARSASLPSVDLTGSYGYSQVGNGRNVLLDDPVKTLRAGVTVSFNLFNGFQTRIDRQNAVLYYRNQELYKDEALLTLQTDIADAYESFSNSRKVLELEQSSLEAADLNFTRTQELFNLGQVTTTQFREAQLNLFKARYGISSAKYSAKLNEINLLRISGNLVGNEQL